jgi:hypothetical protein
MGFEAGQHEAESSVDNHESFIWLAMVASGALDRSEAPGLGRLRERLERSSGGARVVEVRYRHPITQADDFKMESGYENFSPVRRGQLLARDSRGLVVARESGMVLLPLYQALGDDGFFLGRKVPSFWLRASELLRHLRVGDYVHLLPGVRRDRADQDLFFINRHVAKFLPLQVFHLLGFRKRLRDGNMLIVCRRRFDFKGPDGSLLRVSHRVGPDTTRESVSQ